MRRRVGGILARGRGADAPSQSFVHDGVLRAPLNLVDCVARCSTHLQGRSFSDLRWRSGTEPPARERNGVPRRVRVALHGI